MIRIYYLGPVVKPRDDNGVGPRLRENDKSMGINLRPVWDNKKTPIGDFLSVLIRT